MVSTQIILYNQLRKEYLHEDSKSFLYIHHIWKIMFQWEELILNTGSKIIDYAWWRNFINELLSDWKQANFVISKSFFTWLKDYAKKNSVSQFSIVKPVENYVYNNFLKIQKQLQNIWITLEFIEDTQSFYLSHEDFLKQSSRYVLKTWGCDVSKWSICSS